MQPIDGRPECSSSTGRCMARPASDRVLARSPRAPFSAEPEYKRTTKEVSIHVSVVRQAGHASLGKRPRLQPSAPAAAIVSPPAPFALLPVV